MIFPEFLKEQERIYRKFKRAEVRTLGTKPDEFVSGKRTAGYFLAYRYPTHVTEAVSKVSTRISEIVPAMIYDGDIIHTTISDCLLEQEDIPDEGMLDNLIDAASVIEGEVAPEITFNELLCNRTTVIFAGMPDQQFLSLSRLIIDEAAKYGVKLRDPWGAHVTVARFLDTVSAERLGALFGLLEESRSLGTVRPDRVDAGYFQLNPTSVHVYGSFPLTT